MDCPPGIIPAACPGPSPYFFQESDKPSPVLIIFVLCAVHGKIKLKYFLRYIYHQTDDSPLYIFDSHFDDHDVAKGLLEDFRVPSYFPDDLFALVGERRRPPYRYFQSDEGGRSRFVEIS